MTKKIISMLFIIIIFIVCLFNVNIIDNMTTKSIDYNGNNLLVSVDGISSSTLPTSGTYYLADYNCSNSDVSLSWDKSTYKLSVTSGNKKSNISCNLNFQSQPLISYMEPGSYVSYTGNNGCSGNSCSGQNANYVSSSNMGYCSDSTYIYTVNGWRIGYTKKENAYLVSAGATDCLCTNSDGSTSSNSCDSYIAESSINVHYNNTNSVALKYCNASLVEGGVCNTNSTWAYNGEDFLIMSGIASLNDCNGKTSRRNCGFTDDLIDIGSYYWLNALNYGNYFFSWIPYEHFISPRQSNSVRGVRPVIKLASTVVVTGGDGTKENPYTIANNNFTVNEVSMEMFSFEEEDGGNGEEEEVAVTNKSNLKINLVSTDDVDTMCVSVGTSGCANYVKFSESYNLDLSNHKDGKITIYVYYKDKSGKVVSSMRKDIVLDTVAPTNNSVVIGESTGYKRELTLKSNGAKYMCLSNTSKNSYECNEWINYQGSYEWKLNSGDGDKTVYAFFKDEAGNISEVVSDTVTVTKDCLDINEVVSLNYTGEVINSLELEDKLCYGSYKVQVWGAQGGNSGGKGGYSAGDIILTGSETLYFYVGGMGSKGIAGFNGGGSAGSKAGGGGGATDIRINSDSLYARVIVAGGGGGKGQDSCALGGAGGGTTGIGGNNQSSCGTQGGAGTQNAGGAVGKYNAVSGANAGAFGNGGNATDGSYDGGAGGGGWYGGGAGVSSSYSNGGGGGSGFVYKSGATVPGGYLVNSSYYLSNATTISGDKDTIPTTYGTGTETGHAGNGYIKITRLT